MNWSDYEERYGESRADFDEDEEDREKCTYCEAEDSEENPVIIRKITTLGKHFRERVCKQCLAEMLEEEKETIVSHAEA